VRERSIPEYRKMLEDDWDQILDKEALEKRVAIGNTKTSGVKFDPKMLRFSPTALQVYETCPKKYELKQIFRMPERGDFDSDDSTSMGSFIHKILQQGVSQGFAAEKMFTDLASEMSKEKEWEGIDLEDANKLLTVFWRRNSGTYDSRSMCEKELSVSLDGFHFYGKADRIDYLTSGDVRIVDYKTGRGNISPKDRARQLGFYAIGVKEALGLTPKKLVLDFLRKEKPFEVELEGDKADAGRSRGFNLDVVKKELVGTALKIASDFENEFLPTRDDSPCFMCGYKFYCPKWEER
jgi:RecB family exonuclease